MNLIWLRNDLRLEDNPALYQACQQGPSLCVYIATLQQWQTHDDAPHKTVFWQRRLIALAQELKQRHIPFKLLTADNYPSIPSILLQHAQQWHVQQLWFNQEYPLNEKQRDQHVCRLFSERNITVHTYHGDVVQPPGSVLTQAGTPYHVFSPFARQWRKQAAAIPLTPYPAPEPQSDTDISSDDIASLWPHNENAIEPSARSTPYRDDLWPAETTAIHAKLQYFIKTGFVNYKDARDIPSIAGTSTLSPYLMCGALGVRQCLHAAQEHSPQWLEHSWTNELVWREFYRHLTDCYAHLSRGDNFKATQHPIPWENDPQHWQAWRTGKTGYPIVDAAIKQLLQTGWMHNRLRMITAAFLTKLLLIDWRWGEQFFMAHLIDGDYASNNGGWQWAASTGADAVPYFRIFNPERQSQRFDPDGQFIKRFLPELASINAKNIHNPSQHQREVCGYPQPIIDYRFARQRALDGYANAMGKATPPKN